MFIMEINSGAKAIKLRKIEKILRDDLKCSRTESNFNFLSRKLRKRYNIVDTANVSSNDYDETALSIINQHRDGLILDCGAGKRAQYHENVVNYEIVPYETTDVLGVGEELPFKDNVFDAVFSLAVLEHVKDPFKCAAEIARVLKVGGTLYCVVPFLQPMHGFPHHYYNMSAQGLRNLFESHLAVQRQDVIPSGLPIWTLVWILNSWLDGLHGEARSELLEMRVSELIGNPIDYFDKKFVRELSVEKNFELASTTAIIATKKCNRSGKFSDSGDCRSEPTRRRFRSFLAQVFGSR